MCGNTDLCEVVVGLHSHRFLLIPEVMVSIATLVGCVNTSVGVACGQRTPLHPVFSFTGPAGRQAPIPNPLPGGKGAFFIDRPKICCATADFWSIRGDFGPPTLCGEGNRTSQTHEEATPAP